MSSYIQSNVHIHPWQRSVHIPGQTAMPPGISHELAWEKSYHRNEIDPYLFRPIGKKHVLAAGIMGKREEFCFVDETGCAPCPPELRKVEERERRKPAGQIGVMSRKPGLGVGGWVGMGVAKVGTQGGHTKRNALGHREGSGRGSRKESSVEKKEQSTASANVENERVFSAADVQPSNVPMHNLKMQPTLMDEGTPKDGLFPKLPTAAAGIVIVTKPKEQVTENINKEDSKSVKESTCKDKRTILPSTTFITQQQAWKAYGMGMSKTKPSSVNQATLPVVPQSSRTNIVMPVIDYHPRRPEFHPLRPIPAPSHLPVYHHNLPPTPPEATAPPQRSVSVPRGQRITEKQPTEPYPHIWPVSTTPSTEIEQAQAVIMKERAAMAAGTWNPRTSHGVKDRATYRGPDAETIPDSVPIPPVTIQARVTVTPPATPPKSARSSTRAPSAEQGLTGAAAAYVKHVQQDKRLLRTSYQKDYGPFGGLMVPSNTIGDDLQETEITDLQKRGDAVTALKPLCEGWVYGAPGQKVVLPNWCLPANKKSTRQIGADHLGTFMTGIAPLSNYTTRLHK
ncbi:hypothetical protein SpCBS45565_g06366 [Spizellomyces sp. 'palustris']|nr:hypothetical protein SpCBS45565_g06366 [Spizellomyces sp. 'palustris']